MGNELNARLQHAVEKTVSGTQHPANNSVPLDGEIIFNSTRTNFKVGDGTNTYASLSDFFPSLTTETWRFVTSGGAIVSKTVYIV